MTTIKCNLFAMKRCLLGGVLAVAALATSGRCEAQNINVTTPFNTAGESYYENFGVGFGFSLPGGRGPGARVVGLSPTGQLLPNLVFSQGAGPFPPFGGFQPNAGARFGFQHRGPNGGGYSLGFHFAKGSSRTITSTAPSVTVQNGFGGSISSGFTRPFVTGVVPVIGNGYGIVQPIDNGVTRAINSGQLDLSRRSSSASHRPERPIGPPPNYSNPNSTATQGARSVAAIKLARQQRLEAQQKRLEEKLSDAQTKLDQGDPVAARTLLREALEFSDDPKVRHQIWARIKATRSTSR